MTKDEALRLALEALENAREFFISMQELGIRLGVSAKDVRLGERFIADRAITAIKAALANEALERKAENARELGLDYEPLEAKDEPAAWMVYTQDGESVYVTDNPTDIKEGQRALPMYTKPPQRNPMTEKELNVLGCQWHFNLLEAKDKAELFAFARAIEAAHGITGENT